MKRLRSKSTEGATSISLTKLFLALSFFSAVCALLAFSEVGSKVNVRLQKPSRVAKSGHRSPGTLAKPATREHPFPDKPSPQDSLPLALDAIYDHNGCTPGQRYNEGIDRCEWMDALDVLDDMSLQTLEPYLRAGRAAVISAKAKPIADWPAMQRWTPEYFKQSYGSEKVSVQVGRSKRKDFEQKQHLLRSTMSLEEYMDKVLDNTTETNDIYMTSNNKFFDRDPFKPLMDDMHPLLPGIMYKDCASTHFWLGPGGTYTPIHFDPVSILHTQVTGSKTWYMIAPEWRPYLCNTRMVYSSIDFEAPDDVAFEACPTYEYVLPHIIKVTVKAGETLYIPSGWWHVVYSEGNPVISVSFTSWTSKLLKYDLNMRNTYPMLGYEPPGFIPHDPHAFHNNRSSSQLDY
mmetsp:Transcript_23054/g.27859  ORF Transcript_23054/g.27859 Transcript_23054/m.27859 type:complete len:403 (+) Transcript_23054:333-1541(+)|eukprot:CAMPEP_0197858102 /NCGR_PEP_ID=MMETSP1438-20131217/31653_1 /TAXON_ID=1461541 /ORGANISM="Pterosperma sp., Strain CCMP1384" /LENGTH=402 /DNA_ID=CAMNT_0043474157 /DNA_START=333 /DNA_END=1541 /DNA_ORIENTATION=-